MTMTTMTREDSVSRPPAGDAFLPFTGNESEKKKEVEKKKEDRLLSKAALQEDLQEQLPRSRFRLQFQAKTHTHTHLEAWRGRA